MNNVITPGFTAQYGTRAEYVAERRVDALASYRAGQRLPLRLAAPTLVDPLFRLRVDERRASLPAGTRRGAEVVAQMNQRNAADSVVLARTAGPIIELSRNDAEHTVEATRDVLVEVLQSDDLILVATDYTTLFRIAEVLDNGPDDRGRELSMFVQWASSSRFGSHVAILTDALAQRYFTPPTMRTGLIEKWGKAFHVDHTTWDGLWSLVRRCTESGSVTQAQSDMFGTIAQDTAWGRDHVRTRLSNDAANQLFSASQTMADAQTSVVQTDPIGIREALRTGEVCQIVPLTDQWPMDVAVSSPTRLKPGTEYRLFNRSMDRIATLPVTALTVDPTTQAVVASLAKPKSGVAADILVHAVKTKESFYLAPTVYVSPAGKKNASRWAIGQKLEAVEGRQVPLGVLLAGTPTS